MSSALAKAIAPQEQAADPSAASRGPNGEGSRQNIIAIATEEFAAKGFSGARIDEIADLTRTSKRMIYYYFGDKEGLFVAVLEQAYGRIRQIEATLNLGHLEPESALRALVGFTFDYQNANENFIRLVMVENIHQGVHLARSRVIEELNLSAITTLRDICQRGREAGVFRDGIDVVDLHMSISALCFFNVANRATFSRIFKRDMSSAEALARRREVGLPAGPGAEAIEEALDAGEVELHLLVLQQRHPGRQLLARRLGREVHAPGRREFVDVELDQPAPEGDRLGEVGVVLAQLAPAPLGFVVEVLAVAGA
jgi:AcrR family transcriptional regulator